MSRSAAAAPSTEGTSEGRQERRCPHSPVQHAIGDLGPHAAARSPFTDTVQVLAADHQLDVSVLRDDFPGRTVSSVILRGRGIIRVSAVVLDEPTGAQEFIAAHEVAHIALDHHLWKRAWPAALWVSTVLLPVLAVARSSGTHRLRGAAPLPSQVIRVAGVLVAVVGADLLLALRTRRGELEADQLASAWGYRIESCEAILRRHESRHATRWWYRPFRRHPTPDERLEALKSFPVPVPACRSTG